MKAMSSGRSLARARRGGRCRRAGRRGTCARRSASKASRARRACAAKSAEPLEQAAVGVEVRGAELARDAQQLVPVLVADAEGDRHRHDAAEEAGPERVDELLVAADVQDQLVAGLRAEALQMVQDAERPAAQVRQLQRFLGVLAFEVADGGRAAAAVVEHLRECLVLDHRWVARLAIETALDSPRIAAMTLVLVMHARLRGGDGAGRPGVADGATSLCKAPRPRAARARRSQREPRRYLARAPGRSPVATGARWMLASLRFPADGKPHLEGGPYFSISHSLAARRGGGVRVGGDRLRPRGGRRRAGRFEQGAREAAALDRYRGGAQGRRPRTARGQGASSWTPRSRPRRWQARVSALAGRDRDRCRRAPGGARGRRVRGGRRTRTCRRRPSATAPRGPARSAPAVFRPFRPVCAPALRG